MHALLSGVANGLFDERSLLFTLGGSVITLGLGDCPVVAGLGAAMQFQGSMMGVYAGLQFLYELEMTGDLSPGGAV